ncbi:histidine kinase [Clostridium sp. HMP27]|nr:histidine kinase [Clostridium sp. HMP27]
MKQAKEALEYDKLKTEFFANISHELRTPINIIYSSIQLLNMYMENNQLSGNASKVKGYLDIMKQNCGRTIRLVNNLIDTTKMDTNFYNLNLQNHDIVKIIEDITLSTAEYIQDKGIDIIFDTDIEEKIVACDADKIERIMLNLLSNAVKFTEKSGKINVSLQAKKKHIKVCVKDNGIGIQDDKIDLIFERFGQVDRSLVRSHEGSGIGLCLVKSFVEMHGGEITVKSKYGHGSEFIVKLPTKVIEEEKPQEKCEELSKKTNGNFNNHIERVNIEFSDIYL